MQQSFCVFTKADRSFKLINSELLQQAIKIFNHGGVIKARAPLQLTRRVCALKQIPGAVVVRLASFDLESELQQCK